MAVHEIENLYWAAYSELSAIRHGRPMSDQYAVDQLLERLEKAAKAQDLAAPQGDTAKEVE